MTTLADTLAMDRTTLTRNLAPLARKGVIRIGFGVDRRARVVRLTAKGRHVLSRAFPLWEQAQSRIIRGLSEERWGNLLRELAAAVESSRG